MKKIDPFVECLNLETNSFSLRLVELEDAEELLKCYSDKIAVSKMNADNCTSDFNYTTITEIEDCIKFWIFSYTNRYFLRLSIIDKKTTLPIGTIEIFGGGNGVFRIDIQSKYETNQYISELLELASKYFFDMFGNENIYVKAIPSATQRRLALENCGYLYVDKFRDYSDYYKKSK